MLFNPPGSMKIRSVLPSLDIAGAEGQHSRLLPSAATIWKRGGAATPADSRGRRCLIRYAPLYASPSVRQTKINLDHMNEQHGFSFDRVFAESSSQEAVAYVSYSQYHSG